ncbi:DUF4394 domain-containing protein [Saccharothrix coeruleofusca]|uniref:DUF4394 domain-containing protein n=1 Tax=Saccharothrix coeruleofusca TaxID=33919 RepID=A0A918AUW3_9PSEU|nr:DUF4394 domain-containing protein [Saccharothrix coeruleofusca]MBP2336714.1 hypothetical protein [Saccharothrix coeruleofusca]GGP78548.1 hypothetical protein GCM10010185_60440 [Saccharothrix coeruleofusca]
MKARIKRGVAAAAVLLSATTAMVVGSASGGSADAPPSLRAYGITADGKLMFTFTTDHPQVFDWVRTVTGLSGHDTALVGLDFRVQDGALYGVGNYGGIYKIPVTGDAVTKVSQLAVSLEGKNFGVDFNPAADRLRVISDTGQNLRHNLNDGTTIKDKPLNLNGATATGVTAAAYTNNDLNSSTGTTLFDIGTAGDQVLIQSPPNDGTLAPTGSLGVDAGVNAGFDIYSNLVGGKADSLLAFAALNTMSGSAFYTINLLSGAATAVGSFPLSVGDIAVALNPPY